LRAIETGLHMIRSAYTGVSGVIDANGRTVARLPLYEAGVIETPLPQAGATTLYAQFGDAVFWLIWLIAAALALLPRPAGMRR
jgi:apolipoprotein N-acyltransferase